MAATKRTTKQETPTVELADLGLVPVDTIPKSTRTSTQVSRLVEALTAPDRIGQAFQLPPKRTGNAVRKALKAAGWDCTIASRALNGSRAHFVTVTGRTEPETKQEGE